MRRTLKALLVSVATLAASFLLAAPAYARVIHVGPGESIQRAINHASAGDTIIVDPGVYPENLLIEKEGITLVGSGATESGTVLEFSGSGHRTPCGPGQFASGICVPGSNSPLSDVAISGLLVRGFPGIGIMGFGTEHLYVHGVAAADNGAYGMASFDGTGTEFEGNVASGSEEAGFYIGDSPDSQAVLSGNTSYDNQFGFFLRDANNGTLQHNVAHDNCVGFLFLDTYADAHNWSLTDSDSYHNTRACPGNEEAPPLSGSGVLIAGTDAVTVSHLNIWDNVPAFRNALSGGITVVSTPGDGGSDPNNETISDNVLRHNRRYDIRWDGSGTGNTFTGNDCNSSSPPGLC